MAGNYLDLVRRYVEDAIAAEKSFEAQLRGFATDGDDDEVKAAFAAHAEETRIQHERLAARLIELGGNTSTAKSILAHVLAQAPKAAQAGHIQEERTVQNLIMAYSVEASECSMYEALAALAAAAGDVTTAALAREIQQEEKRTAEKLYHFIPTRSIIAYNMLTTGEVDPAVETKVGEHSWIA